MSQSLSTLEVPILNVATKSSTPVSQQDVKVKVPASLIPSVLEKIFQLNLKTFSGKLLKENYKIWPKRMKQQESYEIGVLLQQVEPIRESLAGEVSAQNSVKNAFVTVPKVETSNVIAAKISFNYIVGESFDAGIELKEMVEKLENDCAVLRIIFDKNYIDEVVSCAVLCTVGFTVTEVAEVILANPTKYAQLHRLLMVRKLIHVEYGKKAKAPKVVAELTNARIVQTSTKAVETVTPPAKTTNLDTKQKAVPKGVDAILAQISAENKIKADLESKLAQCNQRRDALMESLLAKVFQGQSIAIPNANKPVADKASSAVEGDGTTKKLTKKEERNQLFHQRKREERAKKELERKNANIDSSEEGVGVAAEPKSAIAEEAAVDQLDSAENAEDEFEVQSEQDEGAEEDVDEEEKEVVVEDTISEVDDDAQA